MQGDAYQSDGTLADVNKATLQTAADGLWGSNTLYVWHRPAPAGSSTGVVGAITSAMVRDKAAILRSRRD